MFPPVAKVKTDSNCRWNSSPKTQNQPNYRTIFSICCLISYISLLQLNNNYDNQVFTTMKNLFSEKIYLTDTSPQILSEKSDFGLGSAIKGNPTFFSMTKTNILEDLSFCDPLPIITKLLLSDIIIFLQDEQDKYYEPERTGGPRPVIGKDSGLVGGIKNLWPWTG